MRNTEWDMKLDITETVNSSQLLSTDPHPTHTPLYPDLRYLFIVFFVIDTKNAKSFIPQSFRIICVIVILFWSCKRFLYIYSVDVLPILVSPILIYFIDLVSLFVTSRI